MTAFTESVVEDAALKCLETIGWPVAHGPEITPGELAAERVEYGQVVLETTLGDALLPKVISGELRVKDAEKFVENAV